MQKKPSVSVVYTSGDLTECVNGEKSVILTRTAGNTEMTGVNISGWDEACEVLEEALDEARRKQRWIATMLTGGNWSGMKMMA